MSSERILILDTETTGLSFEEDRIIEVGVVELNEKILARQYFHEYVNPEKEINISAQKIHGLSNNFLVDKPTFNEIAQKFLDFIKDDVIVIHNAEFDLNFINKELQNCGLSELKNQVIDTLKIAKKEFPGQSVNLDSLCRKLNIINTRKDYHGALLDATLLSKVFLKLTTEKQENLNFNDDKLNVLDNHKDDSKFKENFVSPRNRLMKLSANEKQEHQKFIDGMKNPIWQKIE